jgi:membrane fusion protein (multidrug efflux system)
MPADTTVVSRRSETVAALVARRDAPEEQPARPPQEQAIATSLASEQGPQPTRRHWLRWALFALVPLALIAGIYWYVTGGRIMWTDDAYIQADQVGIATDVSGLVQNIEVTENQRVESGQVLYRLDPSQFQITLDNAKANLAQVALTIDSMKETYRRMLSDIAAQDAQVKLDEVTNDRNAALVRTNAVAQLTYDQSRFALEVDKSKAASLREQAQVQLALLAGNPDIAVTEHPQYLQAQAQVDEAQRQLDHTIVKAPFAGIVTQVNSIAPGKYLAASMTAFFLVDTDHVWIDATPKETELTYVRPGQPVTATVDTYPGAEWHGTVESINPAAAQQFSLLPAQNTSGNWVKVVQRITMRVRLDTSEKDLPPLRAGMSVLVNVDTGHPRGVPQFFSTLFDRERRGT